MCKVMLLTRNNQRILHNLIHKCILPFITKGGNRTFFRPSFLLRLFYDFT
ncbi:hypothetical protein HMPREF1991_02620 [Hoylesella loescheii DSM 19665 = JCM 12249 = ATCC 15930]|uniref:Uncharacterized protein n=1 Tax=Hoylesella loescheii DSM 19665 = JCM 12249 = ATCC 15930 TaxID=1122985 RepID=A0A069QH09_HOYLO|nr:hypothetical protein HMPREF1991_02620 [Hoylesella loescheii DSM 19665 = JCM 12249 = ATCC 15930]